MLVELSEQTILRIARQTAMLMRQQLRSTIAQQYPQTLTTAQAAKLLGISPSHLRKIAARYPHIKRGEGKQARLLFFRDQLLNPPAPNP